MDKQMLLNTYSVLNILPIPICIIGKFMKYVKIMVRKYTLMQSYLILRIVSTTVKQHISIINQTIQKTYIDPSRIVIFSLSRTTFGDFFEPYDLTVFLMTTTGLPRFHSALDWPEVEEVQKSTGSLLTLLWTPFVVLLSRPSYWDSRSETLVTNSSDVFTNLLHY